MENKRKFTVELDMINIDKGSKRLGTVKQFDGTSLEIFVTNDGIPMNLEGCTVRLYASKPNKNYVYQEQGILLDSEYNSISIECKNSIFSDSGTVELECEIYDDDKYVITTPTFSIEVLPKLSKIADADFVEANEIDILDGLVAFVLEKQNIVLDFIDLLNEMGESQSTLENLYVLKQMVEDLENKVNIISDRLE